MVYLLDTSVYSQPLRGKPVEKALQRWSEVGDERCRVSIVTIAEVEWGLHLEQRESRWNKYQALLVDRLLVEPCTEAVWHQFARMKARQQKLGLLVADLDMLIAATAVLQRWTVATLNHQDFSKIEGVLWEDWSR